jgi:hypothetical protein
MELSIEYLMRTKESLKALSFVLIKSFLYFSFDVEQMQDGSRILLN